MRSDPRNLERPRMMTAMRALGRDGLCIALCLGSGGTAEGAATPDPAGVEFFEKKIRPLLVEHCYECHSAAGRRRLRGGLLLDSKAGLAEGRRRGRRSSPATRRRAC